jgi:hypothetical protein
VTGATWRELLVPTDADVARVSRLGRTAKERLGG